LPSGRPDPVARRGARLGLFAAAALLVAAGGWWLLRNPEREVLTDAARAATGSTFAALPSGVTRFELSGPAEGAPVVLVHGFSVPMYIWDSTVTALTGAGFRVLRYDLLGRGWSDRPATDYTADLFGRQLEELLAYTGLTDPVHVVGLSMGGWVVATWASRHPERVRSVTLIDPAAGARQAPGVLAWPVLGPFLWQTVQVPAMAEGQRADFADPSRFPDWADRYRPQTRFRGFGAALRSTALTLAGTDLDSAYAALGRTGLPTLLIWGAEDRTVPISLSDGVRAGIPHAAFHPIAGAGHLPHLERADTVAALLTEFLRQVTPAPERDRERVLAAAREVMAAARYATLVTLGPDGHPQARIVDPFEPEEDFTIWAATNARTRKAAEIAADPRVTLLYFDRAGSSYVTLAGRAELVRDSTERARHWKEEWAGFYRDRHLGDDYLLIRVRPHRLEVSSTRHGVLNDPVTWRPAIVALP